MLRGTADQSASASSCIHTDGVQRQRVSKISPFYRQLHRIIFCGHGAILELFNRAPLPSQQYCDRENNCNLSQGPRKRNGRMRISFRKYFFKK